MLNAETLKKLDGLSLRMRTAARGGAGGVRRSKALGSSAEFSDFREYALGDDIRRIDWNAYARFDRLFLKLFMEEQEAVLTLLVDGSRSMQPKWEAACLAAEALGYLALNGGDRLRIAILTGDKAQISPLYTGRASFSKAAAFLEGHMPAGETRLCALLPRMDLPLARGMCVLISDLFSEDGYKEALDYLLFKKQEVTLLQFLCAEEMEPTLSGAIRLLDSETRNKLELLIGGDELAAYERSLAAFLQEAQRTCHARGIPYAVVRAESAEESLLRDLTKLMMIGQ